MAEFFAGGPWKPLQITNYLKRHVGIFKKSLELIEIDQVQDVEDIQGLVVHKIRGSFQEFEADAVKEENEVVIKIRYKITNAPEQDLTVRFDEVMEYRAQTWIRVELQEVYFKKFFIGVKDFNPVILRFEFTPMALAQYKKRKIYSRS